MLARLAWGVAVLAVLLVVADVVVTAQVVSLTSETSIAVHGFPFVHGAAVGCALMGALIVSRYRRHPIGWLLSVVGAFTSVSLLAEGYAYWVREADGPGSRAAAGVAAWLAQLFGGQIVIAVLALLFLLAPDGRFVSRRWRYVALVPAVGSVLCLAAVLTIKPTEFDLAGVEERFGPVRQVALSVGFLLICLGMALAWVSVLRRLRGSTGEERQQLRLIALSAGLAAAGLVILASVQAANGGEQTWVSAVPLFASFLLLPVLFAVAVLRYRLYDLDVIINQTVVVAAGTAFAAVGYTTLVVLAGRLAESRAGGYWLSLAVTAAVALAFQPMRRIIVRWANRAAYGDRARPYEALADFGRRLADAPDPDDLLPAIAEAAGRAVSARGALASLDVPGGAPTTATWGWWPSEPDQWPRHDVVVRTEGHDLGRLAVVLRRGRSLRSSDVRLLEALADQTGVAFRNTSLAGTLATRVTELDRTTRELTGSRLRLIEADDEARRALESAIVREVLPFLAALPAEIGRARAAVGTGRDDPGLDRLVDGTHEALEALRELTRGVFPAQLARAGLAPALRSLVGHADGRAHLTVDGTDGHRYPARVEAAVYYCALEALRAGTGRVSIALAEADEGLVLRLSRPPDGLDVLAVTDRVEAAGGALAVEHDTLVLSVPIAASAPAAGPRRGAPGLG